jgi:MotA/TolQ/ExbB proton channel family
VLAHLDSSTLQAVARASKRSSSLVHEELREGVYSLATIASIAPWFGLFGTILGIVNSFQGITGDKTSGMAALAKRLSEAMWPTALGLLVGMIAFWSYDFVTGRLRTLDQEMENTSLELLSQLSRFHGRFMPGAEIGSPSDRPMFGEKTFDQLSRDEKSLRRSILVTGTAFLLAWCALAVRYFGNEWVSLSSAVGWGFVYVILMFGISCFPAYPVWVKVLGRRPGGLAALGSVVCLCWSIAELVLGSPLP